jgi:hypothetical protein
MIVDSALDQSLINLAVSKGIKILLGHNKPYGLKRSAGINVLAVKDIVDSTAKKAKIPPAPAPPKPKKVETKKEVKK